MKQYQSREYCKSISCIFQLAIEGNKVFENTTADEIKKAYCKTCEAYKFHQWLKNNGYKIVKKKLSLEEILKAKEELLED